MPEQPTRRVSERAPSVASAVDVGDGAVAASDADNAGSDTGRLRATVARSLWVVVAAVLSWPLFDRVPHQGLDRSWNLALSMLHQRSYQFGSDVVFNYGPLGFVKHPMLGTGRLFFVGVACLLILVLLICWMVFETWSHVLPGRVHLAGIMTVGTMLVAPVEGPIIEIAAISMCVLLTLVCVVDDRKLQAWQWVGVGSVTAVLALIKVSVAPVLVVVLFAVAWRHGRRSAAWLAGGIVVGFVVLWLVTGQAIGDVPSWVRGTISVAVGHTEAMNDSSSRRNWEYAAFAGVLIVVAGTAVQHLRSRQWPTLTWRVGVVCLVAVVSIWFSFRQGFTRHGARSRLTFFVVAWITVGLLPWSTLTPRLRQIGAAGVSAAVVCMVLITPGSVVTQLNPLRRVDYAVETAELVVVASERSDQRNAALSQARSTYRVPDEMLATIGTAPVHVGPIELAVAWAYNLNWVPLPTLQRYIGYTDHLDELNADFLLGNDAPTYVLRQANAVIDGRFGPAEGPRYSVALFCQYRQLQATPQWELLERSTNRCGSTSPVGDGVDLAPGDTVEVPLVGDSEALLVAVEFHAGVLDTVATALLKPVSNPELVVDGQPFRMIPATSGTPSLLSVPPGTSSVPVLGAHQQLSVTEDATITFFRMDTRS